jgi:hypothetical protein
MNNKNTLHFELSRISKISIIFCFLLIILTSLACTKAPLVVTPVTTPLVESTCPTPLACNIEKSHSTFVFPDGSMIWTTTGTEIQIETLAAANTDTPHQVKLVKGEMLVFSALPDGEWFGVSNPKNEIGRVTGSVAYAFFDPKSNESKFICIIGRCQYGLNVNSLENVPLTSDYATIFDHFGEGIPEQFALELTTTPVIPVSGGGTATPDFAATATSVCNSFQSQFPGTPCP